MANQNDTASTCTKQFKSTDITDLLKGKFSQLEAIIDLLNVSLDSESKAVFKKKTIQDSVWLIEDLVIEIKYLFMENIKEKE